MSLADRLRAAVRNPKVIAAGAAGAIGLVLVARSGSSSDAVAATAPAGPSIDSAQYGYGEPATYTFATEPTPTIDTTAETALHGRIDDIDLNIAGIAQALSDLASQRPVPEQVAPPAPAPTGATPPPPAATPPASSTTNKAPGGVAKPGAMIEGYELVKWVPNPYRSQFKNPSAAPANAPLIKRPGGGTAIHPNWQPGGTHGPPRIQPR